MPTALSWRLKSSPVSSYVIAVLSVATAIVLSLAFDHLSLAAPSLSLFLCAVMFVGWAGGTGPALLATALSVAAFGYFFPAPTHSLSFQLKDVSRLVLFGISALFVVLLGAAQRRAAELLRVENAERKRAEEKARLTEEGLRAIIDTIPALVARRGADGAIDFVNQTWLTFTGLRSSDDPRGLEAAAFHPEDRLRIDEEWRSHLAKGEAFDTEYRVRAANGEYRWLFVRRVPLRDRDGNVSAWYGVGYDIEDRKRAESSLQRSEAYLAEAQKLSRTGSFAWEFSTGDYFWSDECYEIMAVDRSVRPSVDLVVERVHPDDRPLLRQEMRRAARRVANQDYRVRLLLPDGTVKHLHVIAHYVKYPSGKEENIGALMDVTEAVRAQEALDAAKSALAHATRVATLGEISATIAHEVNQPLAAIVANGQACLRFLRRDTPDLGEVEEGIASIVSDGNRASEIILRVRGLLKKADTQKAPVDVNGAVGEVVALLQRELADNQVSLRLDLAPTMPPAVADRVQLQQVIINLMMNGLEAMHAVAGGPRELSIRSHVDEADRVAVAVTDSGVGIPVGTTDRLFQAFFSTKPKGLGMGLSICRSIIEDHGGQLWATNNSGSPGATFQFIIPAARDNVS